MPQDNLVFQAVESCKKSKMCFCKFISANDSGETGGHQSGLYIPKNSIPLLFDKPGQKGELKDRPVQIRWQNDDGRITESRFIYYGQKTRNEYRITRFGKGFELLNKDSTGNLFILAKQDDDFYDGFVFSNDDDIDSFLAAFSMSPVDTNKIIETSNVIKDMKDPERLFDEFIRTLSSGFPSTEDVALKAREIFEKIYSRNNEKESTKNPDEILLEWAHTEYNLFKALENHFYHDYVTKPFEDMDRLISVANVILNRRKSRAGKSLEHHLAQIFRYNKLKFDQHAVTELNQEPDFIFPGIKYYFQDKYSKKLVFLAAKTTCKDRWRQILSEADRIKIKHLMTLQQGISSNQLKEMEKSNVILVSPAEYIQHFPEPYRSKILSLQKFISFTKIRTDVR